MVKCTRSTAASDFKQVAPGALAGVRLAGDEQHAQVLAHALGGDDGAVVGGRQLARRRVELDLEDVLPGVRERHLDLDGRVRPPW